MSGLPRHPFVLAVRPVVEALGATLIPADEREPGDMPLRWEDSIIAAVRMAPLHGALDRLIDGVERELGASLPTLAREDKQRAIRLLHAVSTNGTRRDSSTPGVKHAPKPSEPETTATEKWGISDA